MGIYGSITKFGCFSDGDVTLCACFCYFTEITLYNVAMLFAVQIIRGMRHRKYSKEK